MFSAASFPDLLQRGAFLNRILHQDERLVAEVDRRQSEVAGKLSWLQMKQEELAKLQEEKEREELEHEALKKERERKLAQLRNQRAAHEKAAKELESSAARLESVLAELERKRQEALKNQSEALTALDRKNFGANRGKLPWPAQGKILTGFGRQEHPKYRTVTMSKGIDIAAPPGSPVQVVADGVVDLAQWLSGYGQTVIVNHGNGYYTVYAHLASVTVKVGHPVALGEKLGTVGETGSLKGPCLHFELRAGGAPQDPVSWLR
jgi:murein DD-endopeptidase MepM/ murein hydrolase activator NlpD